jgi:hypothetical protein
MVVQRLKSELNPDGSRRFPNNIMLNWRQIMSFFNRLSQQKKKQQLLEEIESHSSTIDTIANSVLNEIDENEGDEELQYQVKIKNLYIPSLILG